MSNITSITPTTGYLNKCWQQAQAKRAQLERDIVRYAQMSDKALQATIHRLARAHSKLILDGQRSMIASGTMVTPKSIDELETQAKDMGAEHAARILAQVEAKRGPARRA